MNILCGSLHFFMVPGVVWLQCFFHSKSTFLLVPFTFYSFPCCLVPMCFSLKINILGGSLPFTWFFVLFGSQCCLAPICFPLKINFLFGSLHFLWFPVLFGANVFPTQNQHFGWFNIGFDIIKDKEFNA